MKNLDKSLILKQFSKAKYVYFITKSPFLWAQHNEEQLSPTDELRQRLKNKLKSLQIVHLFVFLLSITKQIHKWRTFFYTKFPKGNLESGI